MCTVMEVNNLSFLLVTKIWFKKSHNLTELLLLKGRYTEKVVCICVQIVSYSEFLTEAK